ncbi:hypothetical protein HJD18_03485 [Thermoleophilia bacterium SCSIO 60948]|nr:hypothetical protein HJD18_03485 [Thermoleophilia bacterium SCSIO 60948]
MATQVGERHAAEERDRDAAELEAVIREAKARSRRRRLRLWAGLLAGGAIATIVALWAVDGPANDRAPSGPAPTSSAAGGCSSGVPPTDRPTAATSGSSTYSLSREARTRWPGDFGGVWRGSLRRDAPIYVAFTCRAEERVERLAESFPQPNRLEARTVDVPLASLNSVRDEINEDTEMPRSLRPNGIPGHVSALYTHSKGNFVNVGIEQPTPELKRSFRAAYGPTVRVRDRREQFFPSERGALSPR